MSQSPHQAPSIIELRTNELNEAIQAISAVLGEADNADQAAA